MVALDHTRELRMHPISGKQVIKSTFDSNRVCSKRLATRQFRESRCGPEEMMGKDWRTRC